MTREIRSVGRLVEWGEWEKKRRLTLVYSSEAFSNSLAEKAALASALRAAACGFLKRLRSKD
jgi:hypothetical protein